MEHSSSCGKITFVGDERRIRDLQSRVDDILAGNANFPRAPLPPDKDERPFAPFLPGDIHCADALSTVWMDVADTAAGIAGLELAVNHMYESLGNYPNGMVEYAAKLFLTHYRPAREVLLIRSLEERQPRTVRPSKILRFVQTPSRTAADREVETQDS